MLVQVKPDGGWNTLGDVTLTPRHALAHLGTSPWQGKGFGQRDLPATGAKVSPAPARPEGTHLPPPCRISPAGRRWPQPRPSPSSWPGWSWTRAQGQGQGGSSRRGCTRSRREVRAQPGDSDSLLLLSSSFSFSSSYFSFLLLGVPWSWDRPSHPGLIPELSLSLPASPTPGWSPKPPDSPPRHHQHPAPVQPTATVAKISPRWGGFLQGDPS